jgi:hypothetical protein
MYTALVGAVLLSGGGVASAATTRTDTVQGAEVAYTSTQGTFTGYADGDLAGAWTAVINHTVLSPNATITGGTLTLLTVIHWLPATVEGTFADGGTVTRVSQQAGCGDQKYAVKDKLVHVGADGGSGTGDVSATLTHHRHRILGRCVAYAATITGTVHLTF